MQREDINEYFRGLDEKSDKTRLDEKSDKTRFEVLNELPRSHRVLILNDLKMIEVKITGFELNTAIGDSEEAMSIADVLGVTSLLRTSTLVHAHVTQTHDDGLTTSMVQAFRAMGRNQAEFKTYLNSTRIVPATTRRQRQALPAPITKKDGKTMTYKYIKVDVPARSVQNVPLAVPDPRVEDLEWYFVIKILTEREEADDEISWISINCKYDLSDLLAKVKSSEENGGVQSKQSEGSIIEVYLKLLRTKKNNGSGKKRLISAVIPEDATCLQQSVVLLIAYYLDYKRYKLLNKAETNIPGTPEHAVLNYYVTRVSSLASIDTKLPCGLEEAKKICVALSNTYNKEVVIFCFGGFKKNVIWRTTTDVKVLSSSDAIFLDVLLQNEHFTPMTHMHLLLGNRRHFCRICCIVHDDKNTHACRGSLRPSTYKRCALCYSKSDDHVFNWKQEGSIQGSLLECCDCNRKFINSVCLARHKTTMIRKKTLCAAKWRCVTCDLTFRVPHREGYSHQFVISRADHVCGNKWCKSCKQWTVPNHTCYLQTQELPKPCPKVYYYDFETVVHAQEHKPVLCVVNESTSSDYRSFWAIEDLVTWMLSNPGTYIAHNAQSFDAHLLIQQFILRTDLSFKFTAVNGNKILSATISSKGSNLKKKDKVSIRLIDSLCFLPFGLRKFSKTFDVTVLKGYFPYRFATKIGPTLEYVGQIPKRSFFDIPFGEEKSFEEWYSAVEQNIYNLANEMLKYCVDDVRLLKLGCEAFRDSFFKATGVDPLSKCTIAGACSAVFNSNFLKENSMEILKVGLDRRFRKHFVGGRTEVFRLHYKCLPDEKIQYVDFCSLYPWVNKYCAYPTGEHISYNFETKYQLFDEALLCLIYGEGAGLVEVDITPPDDLWVPLLHSKHRTGNGPTKLFFDLRKKERAIYTSFELKKALALKYVVTRVYNIWWWKKCTSGFGGSANYMNTFLKLKQEASGWPESVLSPADQANYVNEYKAHEGISLDPANIAKNPGLRLVSKLCLNSLWGRQGMKPSSSFNSKHLIYDDDEGIRTINELRTRVQSFHILAENCALFNVKGQKEADEDQSLQRSLVSAIFTTAHARLKLYSVMEKLGDRLCYCDTDSIIFIDRPNEWRPPLGKFLGDLTNELGSDNYNYSDIFATEFVGVSAKSYSLKTTSRKHDFVKVKGHSLARKDAREKLTFETLKEVVYNRDKVVTVNYSNNITRNTDFRVGHQDQTTKKFGWTFDKRKVQHRRDGDVFTMPHK